MRRFKGRVEAILATCYSLPRHFAVIGPTAITLNYTPNTIISIFSASHMKLMRDTKVVVTIRACNMGEEPFYGRKLMLWNRRERMGGLKLASTVWGFCV